MAGGIKTGNKGLEIDGKVYEYESVDPVDAAAGIDPITADSGDIKVDKSKKDLSQKTRTTLAKYLSDVTLGKEGSSPTKNQFAVNPPPGGPTSVVMTSLTDNSGNPIPIVNTTNTERFAEPNSINPYSDNFPKVVPDLQKGKRTVDGTDGNELLKGVKKDDPGKLINDFTSAVLAHNRFSDSIRTAAGMSGNGVNAKPSGNFNPTLHHPRYGDVSLRRLAQIGTALSLRASQELNAANAGNNPTSGGQEVAALLPGFNQLGASRIDANVLEAADVLATLTNDEVPDGDFAHLADLSWGSMNNVDDPYSGIAALGMIALSIALTAAITLLFEGLGFLLALVKGSSTGAARNISGRYVLGRHTVTKQADPNAFPPGWPPNVGALLGIRATTFPLGSALKKGTAAFFGIDDSGGFGAALISGLNSAASAPGFNSIVSRTIIRSSLSIIDAFSKAFSSASIKNILSIIDVIRSSKLIAAINIFAMIGDQILTEPDNKPIDAIPEEPNKNSAIDAQPDGLPAEAVRKNRLGNTLKLAWASNRSPALYLVPDSILTMAAADQKMGGFKGIAGLTDDKSKTSFKVQTINNAHENGARISRNDDSGNDPNTVKSFEAALDAEYVPFSFHDLRTNELISFHAFLTSLNDDYTANYETTDGYGRVDPIKVYKNTNRRVGMSFYVIATSERDFDDMWLKINKLVTLVYPQYTRGRLLVNSEQNLSFVQPFSQLIGSTPLIRIRLGDLFRSNYSRFAMARLFGLGGRDDINLGNDGRIAPFATGEQALHTFKTIVSDPLFLSGYDSSAAFTLGADGWSAKLDGGLSIPMPIGGGPDKPEQATTMRIDMQDAPYVVLTIKEIGRERKTANVTTKLMDATMIQSEYGIPTLRASEIALAIKDKYNNPDNIKFKITGKMPYTVTSTFLKPTNGTLKKIYNKVFASEQASIDKISEFLDIKKNALIRSFNSVQGKGLAGVIETMSFDWYDKVTWDTRPDSTAPKMCKVTLSFAPIHDISPGIDHLGYNRAPVYPVGSAMRIGNDPEKSQS